MKTLFTILIASFSIFLLSCSSSYRSMQTTDDVYYSPAQENDGYVSVQNSDDEDSYGYRNDSQEDWYIRQGIRNPLYRSSLSFNLSFGDPFYNPYNPFMTYPMFGMGYGFNYPGLWDPFAYSPFYNPFYRYKFGYSYFPYFGNPYGGHGYYSNYYNYNSWYGPIGVNLDNGPRRVTSNVLRLNNTTPGTGNGNKPYIAPIRTMGRSGNNPSSGGIIERNIPAPRNNNATQPSRNIRRFFNRSSGNNNNNNRSREFRSTTPSENYRYTPPRDINPAPTRTFERSTPPPSNPPSNNNGGGHAPVRKF